MADRRYFQILKFHYL